MDTSVLRQIGLNDSEVKVYFALLELESSSVGPIIEKSRVPDSKIYSIMERLKEKGLVSFVIKNNVKHFQASDPKNLLNILTEKKKEIEEQKRELEDEIIPNIEKKRKLTEDKQEAVVYESYAGVKAAFNLILDNLDRGDEYLVFMLGDSLKDKKVIRFFQNYHNKRISKGIKTRLVSQPMYKEIIRKSHKYKHMEVRFVNQSLPIGTFIFRNHVMTVVWGEKPTAFVIKSKKNYEHYRDFFEDVWRKR